MVWPTGKEAIQLGHCFGIKGQVSIQELGQGLLGQIVFGRSETSCEDDEITSITRNRKNRQETIGIISNCSLEINVDP